jgi:putative ABC transport system permease protein
MARGTQLLSGPRAGAARLTLDDLEAVAGQIPDVAAWDPQQAIPDAAIRRGDLSITARVLGMSERSERVWGRSVSSGDYFDAAAVAASSRVALIGETVARRLFQDADPLDSEILIGPVPFRIVGVLERFGTDLHGMDRDNEVVVPISTMMRRVMNVDDISAAKMLVVDPSRVPQAARDVARVLRERHGIASGQPDDFTLITSDAVQRMAGGVQRIFAVYLPLVAGIALLVGAIVTATIMLASVQQRVAEIGLRRAVGAQPGDIGRQIVLETALVTLAGGLGGLTLGLGVARYVSARLQLDGFVSWKAIVAGLIVSALVALAAGWLPARRASRLQPVDALR